MKFKIFFLVVTLLFISLRFPILNSKGGDYSTYTSAVKSFLKGENIYHYTVKSFEDPNDNLENGYAYMPTLLYLLSTLYVASESLSIKENLPFLWKIPNLLSELIIIYLILRNITLSSKYRILTSIVFSLFWIFSPHLISQYNYTMFDMVFLVFTVLSIKYLKKNILLSSLFFAIAVSFKTISIILLPMILIYLHRSKVDFRSKIKHIFSYIFIGILFYIAISIPFITTLDDLNSYIKGSLLVHGDREVSGRPLISFVNYLLTNDIDLMLQYQFFNFFALLALLAPIILNTYLSFKDKSQDFFKIATFTFGLYIFLTPVLNRTHLLWILPILFLYLSTILEKKNYLKINISVIVIWFTLFIYLINWQAGFRLDKNNTGLVLLPNANKEWEFTKVIRNYYYEVRGNFLNK